MESLARDLTNAAGDYSGKALTLTEDETKCIRTLREWSKREQVRFTATLERGVWHCVLLDRNGEDALIGGGASFAEAFNNLESD
jgi:hypothetical protein